MSTLTYTKGDATFPLGDGHKVIPHICNDLGAWGAGFVLALSRRWERPEKNYSYLAKDGELRLGEAHFVQVEHQITVVNMIAQHGVGADAHNRPPIRYSALVNTMHQVAGFCRADNSVWTSIHAPRFGSGLAGGDWRTIEQLILEVWVDQGIPVTIYDLP